MMTHKRPSKHHARYPWEVWFNRSRTTLHKGVDYKGRTDSMVQMIRNKARSLGIRVSMRVADDSSHILLTVANRDEG